MNELYTQLNRLSKKDLRTVKSYIDTLLLDQSVGGYYQIVYDQLKQSLSKHFSPAQVTSSKAWADLAPHTRKQFIKAFEPVDAFLTKHDLKTPNAQFVIEVLSVSPFLETCSKFDMAAIVILLEQFPLAFEVAFPNYINNPDWMRTLSLQKHNHHAPIPDVE